jgi:thymidylate kinase
LNFNLKTVLFEGPDCAGKTSAYREVHRHTKFRWNIHDRSTLSMLCYAIQYGRDPEVWRRLLHEELSDLNNVMIVFLPPLRVILERLNQRGDEFQTVDSIAKLYQLFEDEAEKIKNYPNVIIYRTVTRDYRQVTDLLLDYEKQTYDKLGNVIEEHVSAGGNEQINLRMSWSDNDFNQIDETRLSFEKEVKYYNDTKLAFIKKIRNELDGLNEYRKIQTHESRRFVLTQDTCISFVQALVREGQLHMNIVCRSSEVAETFKHDIHFLGDLGRIAKTEIGVFIDKVHYTVTLGSAHILR